MTRRRNDFLVPTLAILFDAVAIELSFLFAYWLRFNTSVLKFLPLNEDVPPLGAYLYSSCVVIVIWLLVFKSGDMYGARRNVSLGGEIVTIIRRVTFGMLIVMSATFFYRAFSYSRVVFVLLWMIAIVFISMERALLIAVEKNLYKLGRELRNAVIIGANEAANRIFQTFRDHPLLGYRIAGYFADAPCIDGSPLSNATYLGRLDVAPDILVREEIELALIALRHDQHPSIYSLMEKTEGVHVEFLMVPDVVELVSTGLSVKEIEGIPFVKIKGMPMSTWGRELKRGFDALLSAILLVLFSPLFLLAAIVIKLDSRGPIFFTQERVGMDGGHFSMIKFRSMKTEAEKHTGPVWAKEQDPRRTRIGALLRKTSIDELPQLLNVLKGEMSLVGPRPERPHFVEQFQHNVPKYLDRHRVKTGMTGWAQVNGLRGNTSLEERIKYDIFYIENWSLGFDLKILMKTFGALFATKNVH